MLRISEDYGKVQVKDLQFHCRAPQGMTCSEGAATCGPGNSVKLPMFFIVVSLARVVPVFAKQVIVFKAA